MSSYYCFTFSALEISVRYCDFDANSEDIISCYVHMGLARAKQFSDLAAVKHAHMRVVDTLIDSMCDHCLPSTWRDQCYRYIKRLLPLMYEILDHQQYHLKVQEIRSLHTFYLNNEVTRSQLLSSSYSRLPRVKKQL